MPVTATDVIVEWSVRLCQFVYPSVTLVTLLKSLDGTKMSTHRYTGTVDLGKTVTNSGMVTI